VIDELATVAPDRTLVPIPRRELIHHAVQSALKDYIVDQRLQAGDPLPAESDLARALGVSRSSVREAVKALQGLGIIEARSGSGLYVREFSLDAVLDHLAFGMLFNVEALREILDIRQILESGLVERVVQLASTEQRDRLRLILGDWRAAAERGEYSAESDRAFHAALYERSDNPLVGQVVDAFWRVFYEARARALVPEPIDPIETFDLHVAILAAIDAGDIEALRVATRNHHEGIKRRVSMAPSRARPADDHPASEERVAALRTVLRVPR
jgi:DNA-binding FadR family transcriptional regulator